MIILIMKQWWFTSRFDDQLSPSIPIYPAGKIQWYPLFLRLLVHLALILGIHHQASVIRLGQVPLQFQGAFGHLKNRCFQWHGI
jgi:hypothetical protein